MKKVTSCVLAAAMVAGSMGVVNASTDSIIGRDRFETAAKIADRVGNYNSVVLVNGYSTADGLSASSLAKYKNAPILLVKKDYIPSSTLQRLNNVSKVYIIGGTGAISQSIENQLVADGKTVDRIGGKDRIDTSLQVADRLGNYSKAFIVNGYRGEADAMSVAPVAARDKAPIIITNGRKAPTAREAGVKYYAIGGNAVVQNGLAGSYGAERLSGSNRYATNKRILNKFYSGSKKLYVTNGETLVDALAVSTIASNDGVALVNRKSDKSILEGKDIVQVGGMNFSISTNNTPPVIKTDMDRMDMVLGETPDLRKFNLTAYDKEDGDLTFKVMVKQIPYPDAVGEYKLELKVTDSGGLTTYKTLILNVVEGEGDLNTEENLNPGLNLTDKEVVDRLNSDKYQNIAIEEFFAQLDKFRIENNKIPAEHHDKVNKSAYIKSKHMIDNNYLDHRPAPGTISIYSNCAYFTTYIDSDNSNSLEEAAKYIGKKSFEMWRDDAPHRDMMLNDDFELDGFGYYLKVESAYDSYISLDVKSAYEQVDRSQIVGYE